MGRTTPAWTWFMGELVALEPGTENSGTYTYKPGYHASRADNIVMDKTDNTTVADYSIRDDVDQLGPSDCSAAGDWTHKNAQSGNYVSMDKYGERLQRAWEAKDPRLNGWREALGQTDLDATPEALDFRYWTTRTPDSTHEWHWHFSESRAYAESYDNKKALLSILKGETLAQYLAAGGVILRKDGKGPETMATWDQSDENVAWATTTRTLATLTDADEAVFRVVGETAERHEPNNAKKRQVAAHDETMAQLKVIADGLSKLLATGGSADTAVIVKAVNDAAAENQAAIKKLEDEVTSLQEENKALQQRLAAAYTP